MALGSDRVILGRNNEVVQTLRTDFTKRRLPWMPLSSFPESLKKAVVEIEDQRFYHHFGVDFFGLARAAWSNVRGQKVQGASTLTMQLTDLIQDDVLLKNARITKGSATHKIVQTWRALALETAWSKDQILEAYLNLIHLRGEYQGFPALTMAYLKKEPLALDPAESIVIASTISSPNLRAEILKAKACHFALRTKISSCTDVERSATQFANAVPSLPTREGVAPHLAARLAKAYPQDAIIHSSIDERLQKDVTAILEANIRRLRGANVQDTAAIVIDNRTGQVLAYVGAVSTSESPHVDGIQAYRQAGSSLKPFMYAKAIDMKLLTASSIFLDEPTALSWGKDVYRPSNYDKHFYGPVSAREALGSSLNVPAVKTVMTIGLHQTYQVLQSLHFSNLKEPDYYGVSMALGAVEVRLDDLANAYRAFANQGEWSPIVFDSEHVPKQETEKRERIFGAETSFIMSSILSDPNARSIGFGWESPLETPFWTAVKTGTSKDYRDNWCVGYSEHYTVAVWAGNFDAEAMRKVSGVTGVGPSWYGIMVRLHSSRQSHPPIKPDGVVSKKIRHAWVSHSKDEFYISGTEPMLETIEPVLEKRAQFVFPAENSILVKDPHLSEERVGLYVRFQGVVPQGSRLLQDGADVGEAVSPVRLPKLAVGNHKLSIISPDGKEIAAVRFQMKGADL